MQGKSIMGLIALALKAKRGGSTAIYVDTAERQKFLQESIDRFLPGVGLTVYYRPPSNPRRPR